MKPLRSVLALLVLATPLASQTSSQPTLVLSIIGGVSTSNGLWDVERQPLCPPNASCGPTDPHDTLRVTRDVTPSLVIGVMGTLFRSPHLGLSLEVLYHGLALDDSCTPISAAPDSANRQLCDNITAASLSTSVLAITAGVVVRAAPRSAFSPYARAGFGVLSYSTSTAEASGFFFQNGLTEQRTIMVDQHPKSVGVTGQLAIGFTQRLGPGYQARLEFQDALIPLHVPSGPANDLAAVPTTTRLFHRAALQIGLDVVLEQKRGRRY